MDDGPDLAKVFSIAEFPTIHQKAWYQRPLDVELADGSLSLYEFDSSMEG